jgi:hypothetical protein
MPYFDEPFGFTVFCDDIRPEVGGKTSYMGVYQGGLNVPEFPATLPKFGIVVTVYEPHEMVLKRTWNISLKILASWQDEPLLTAEIPPVPEEAVRAHMKPESYDEPDVPRLMIAHMGFVLSPLALQKPGRIKVRAHYTDDNIIKLGSLKVEQTPSDATPVSTALPQPS